MSSQTFPGAPGPVTDEHIRVAIVDDKPEVRDALGALVASEPDLRLVGIAGDPYEAEDLARDLRPDVVLMDVRMPGGGGVAATARVRAVSPSTKVIAVSAYDDRATVLDMLRAGAAGYIVKGSPGGDILEAIHRAVLGQGMLSGEISSEVVAELASRLDEQARQEIELERRVGRIRSLLDGSGRMLMAFQPIVALDRGTIAGYEALARFPHDPDLGPASCFQEAAALGLLEELEMAALRTAVAAAADRPAGTQLTLNASPQTLLRLDAQDLLTRQGGDVVVEITENAPVDDYPTLGRALERLRAGGVRVAVDDAGAGFASLRHILQLAPDIIKLDGSLVQRIDRDLARRALATALISFAGEIEASIVAEGIETESELLALRELGVRYGQGFFLGRPTNLILSR